MNTIIVKTNDATQTIAQVQVVTKDGKPTIIKAIDKVNYEFHDTAIDRAPNHIITKRKGKDLHVSFEEEGEESDLIIEGFYDSPDSALLGIAEDGEYYYYIPDTGETYDYVTQLEEGAIEGQALGGQSYVAAAVPWWIPAAAGLGLVGLVASSSNDKNPIAPPPNQGPVAVDDSVTTESGTPVTKNIIGNDTDANGDPLTVKDFTVNGTIYQPGVTATIPNVGTITVTKAGELTFTPETGYAGPVPNVDYTVTDGKGGEDTGTVTFNAPPQAQDDTAVVAVGATIAATEEQGVLKDYSGNGITSQADTDPNGDNLTITGISTGAEAGTVGTALKGTYGELTINADGSYSYKANSDSAALGQKTSVVDTFTYTVGDGRNGFDTAQLSITVNATNDTLNGQSTLSMLNASQLGLNGEFYGYNDSVGTGVSGYFQHTDDNSVGNLDQNSDVVTIVNGRNGSNIAGTNIAAKEDVPDARFTATKINYAFQGTLGNNVSAAPGAKPITVNNNYGLASFLNATWAAHRVGTSEDHNDHKSIVVENGMGKTSDAAIRITGLMYLEEGLYDFRVKSDDGFRLMLDNQNVIEFNGTRAAAFTTKNNVYIKGGFVPVELLYYEQGGQGVLDFQYKKSSDQAYQVLDLTQTALLKDNTYNDLQDVAKDASGAWNIRLGDVLDGYGGDDTIIGSDGKDYIMGGAGNDTLTGGTGADKFIYSTKLNNGNDVITDFTVGTDKITLSDVLSAHEIDPATQTWTRITVTNGNVNNMPAGVSNMSWDNTNKVLSFGTQVDGNTVQNTIKFEGLTESYQDYVTFLQANAVL